MLKKSFPVGLVLSAIVFGSLTLILADQSQIGQKRNLLAPPPEYIEQMHFGFYSVLADSIWLRWIQDADTCYAYFDNSGATLEVDRSDQFYNPRHRNCDSSWGFKMLDAVTKLDPRFTMPYLSGAMALSVLVEDYEGASVIFNRGLEVYPKLWTLAYRASYHFLFDKHDLPRAAELLERASQNGGPEWLASLAARLYSRTGQLELGLANLLTYRKAFAPGTPGLKEVDKRISEMKSELQREKAKAR